MIEKDDLEEYLAEMNDRREEAEVKLMARLGVCTLDPIIKRKRLDLIEARAHAIFGNPDYLGFLELEYEVACAIKEWPDDIVGELTHLVDDSDDLVADATPSGGPRKCPTCKEILPAEFFYGYGSESCRDCNVDGRRISEAWEE